MLAHEARKIAENVSYDFSLEEQKIVNTIINSIDKAAKEGHFSVRVKKSNNRKISMYFNSLGYTWENYGTFIYINIKW